MSERSEVVSSRPYGVHPDLWRWNPRTDGVNFRAFLEGCGLPDSGVEGLENFTPRLLGQTPPVDALGRTTALVIGKVQSGKTNSFLALTALAKDHGYRLVVVLSGTKNILKQQTYGEVRKKLSTSGSGWKFLDVDPETRPDAIGTKIQRALAPRNDRGLVITVLKNTRPGGNGTTASGMDRFNEILETVTTPEQRERYPVLIIDDEADEASLDNSASQRRQGNFVQATATYAALDGLRSLFPKHVFVQYTATPQANLLIELDDQLHPDVYELLPPGEGYCGSTEFFGNGATAFVEIPIADQQKVEQLSEEPPQSLWRALVYFFVASAVEDLETENEQPRTMLVHPGLGRASHNSAYGWTAKLTAKLLELVVDEHENPDPNSELNAEIDRAIEELTRSGEVSVDRSALVTQMLERLDDFDIKTVNSDEPLREQPRWEDNLSWIFVGGNVLQRGFALSGLTVTWMPRNAGGGQVDVLLQRGRFFGYRGDYLRYCRVYLRRDVFEDHYSRFAAHEDELWRSLGEHLANGERLETWSRNFWLDPNNSLCRRSSQWYRTRQSPDYVSPRILPREDLAPEIVQAEANFERVANLQAEWHPIQSSDNATVSQKHEFALVGLAEVDKFLEDFTFFGEDVAYGALMRDTVAMALRQDPQGVALVVKMRPDADSRRGANTIADGRGISRKQVSNLAQGASARHNYPGDRKVAAGNEYFHGHLPASLERPLGSLITVQLHNIRRIEVEGSPITGPDGFLPAPYPLVTMLIPEQLNNWRLGSN